MTDLLTPINLTIGGAIYLVACGMAGCYVASCKGRSQMEGFLLAVLLGPCGPVVSACLPAGPARPVADEEERAAERDEEDRVRDHLKTMGNA